MKNDPVFFCYSMPKKGHAQKLEGDEITRMLADDALAWVHLDAAHPNTAAWLRHNVGYLDPLIIEALLAEHTRPRLNEIGDGALIILRGVNLNEDSDPEDMVSLRIWVDQNRIITLQRRRLKALWALADRLHEGSGPTDPGEFIAQVSARLFMNMEPFVSELSEKIDDIEEELNEEVHSRRRHEIIELRRSAIVFRRYFSPQRDVMSQLRASDFSWLNDNSKRHLLENQDRMTRYLEDLDAVRERAQEVKDELMNALSEKLNRNLYVLSLVTSVFLPLSFLTGLLGINVGGMPGAENNAAFWIVSGVCAGLAVIQVVVLKLLKWI